MARPKSDLLKLLVCGVLGTALLLAILARSEKNHRSADELNRKIDSLNKAEDVLRNADAAEKAEKLAASIPPQTGGDGTTQPHDVDHRSSAPARAPASQPANVP